MHYSRNCTVISALFEIPTHTISLSMLPHKSFFRHPFSVKDPPAYRHRFRSLESLRGLSCFFAPLAHHVTSISCKFHIEATFPHFPQTRTTRIKFSESFSPRLSIYVKNFNILYCVHTKNIETLDRRVTTRLP